jgi:hypothetical protein
MASPDQVYREFVRRSHRLLSAYLAIYSWRNNRDCVVLDREPILKFWGVQRRVENERQDWLKADVSDYFPHVMVLDFSKGTKKFAAFYLARRPFPAGAFSDSLSDEKRVKALTAKGFNSAIAPLPSESEMLSILTSAIHGISAFPAEVVVKSKREILT